MGIRRQRLLHDGSSTACTGGYDYSLQPDLVDVSYVRIVDECMILTTSLQPPCLCDLVPQYDFLYRYSEETGLQSSSSTSAASIHATQGFKSIPLALATVLPHASRLRSRARGLASMLGFDAQVGSIRKRQRNMQVHLSLKMEDRRSLWHLHQISNDCLLRLPP
jgi:hypothetical protein